MRRHLDRRRLVAGVIMALGAAAPLAAQPRSAAPHVVIRWSPQVALPGEGAEARRRAGNILGQAGISVSWRECGSFARRTGRLSAECLEPLEPNEVVLRIVQGGPSDPSPWSSLGESVVVLDGRGGWFSTIYSDRVTAMALLANVDVDDVLSRAVAHEVGHLLLGSRSHARHGLMRAMWSTADLRRNATLDWLFSANEARTMREAIARRVPESS